MKKELEELDLGEGIKLTSEQVKTIMGIAGRNITTETEKVKEKYEKELETANTTITDLKGQMESLPKSEELEKLNSKIAEYETEKANREAQEQENAKENEMKTRFSAILGDKKFVNEFTEESFYNKFKSELAKEENVGKGDTAIFETLSNASTNVFQNANQDITTPAVNGASVTKTSDDELRTAMGLDIKE